MKNGTLNDFLAAETARGLEPALAAVVRGLAQQCADLSRYEANPIVLLMEQAGAAASTGSQRILDVVPEALHQRVPLMFGSREEVERVVRYHEEPHRGQFQSPLFRERTLFIR